MMLRRAVSSSMAEAQPLIDRYRPDSPFFMASPTGALLAEGIYARVPAHFGEPGADALPHLSRQVSESLDRAKREGIVNPVAAGAIPFDRKLPACLIIPELMHRSGPLAFHGGELAFQTTNAVFDVQELPEPERYVQGVERGLERIHSGELSKIVLSRSLQLTSDRAVDQSQLLRNLAVTNPRGYTFAVNVSGMLSDGSSIGGGASEGIRVLLGASPELLVSRRGREVFANPLAGSAARSSDPAEDQRRASNLLRSGKDLHEHAVVIEAVARALRPFCKELSVPAAPSLLQTPTMWHLSTEIRGELLDDAATSLELAAALHPTPAVCGTPTEAARLAIGQIEPFDRGFYTGMVGWCDSNGDGEWVVTIRCAEVEDRSVRLYAGAGVVAGSSAEEELKETSAKLRTMLYALGLTQY